ncbi:hypothetical protein GCM10010442_44670 [Kitasatospora kifunensis]
MQALQRLGDQDHAEFVQIAEVPVEAGGGEPGLPGHLPYAESAEVLVLQQPQSGIEQCAAALLLLGGSGSDGVTHIIQ